MHVTVTLKVPVDLAVELRGRLDKLMAARQEDLDRLIKKTKAMPNKTARNDERAALTQEIKLLTVHNLLRIGLAQTLAMPDAQITKLLHETGVARGRPRLARVS